MAHIEILDRQQTVAEILDHIKAEATYPKLKPKLQVKDYARENIIYLKQIQKVQKQETENINPIKSCDKYKHIHSKVSTFMQPSVVQSKCSSLQTSFESSNLTSQKKENGHTVYKPTADSSEETKKPSDISRLQLRQTNYIKINASNAGNTKLKRCSSAPEGNNQTFCKHKPGTLPKYLKERQEQLKKKEEQSKKQLSTITAPPGHQVMSDEERRDTLELLKKNEADLLQHLASLPVQVNTLRMRQHKEDIEKQLAKIEEGIKIFSRSHVFIKSSM